jgi:hypothetical protein
MNIRSKPLARPERVICPPIEMQSSRTSDVSAEHPVKASVQEYLALLQLTDRERAGFVEQAIRRARGSGDPHRWPREAIPELHRALGSRTQASLATQVTSMPPIERRPMVPKEIEYLTLPWLCRSLLAWLLRKRAPAQLSFGKIPGK